jgi:hypothetical protein
MGTNRRELSNIKNTEDDRCKQSTGESVNEIPGTSCTATFYQSLCVEFEATFVVDLESCTITGVTCLGPCPSAE